MSEVVTPGTKEQEPIKIEGVRLEWKGPEGTNPNIYSSRLVAGIARADQKVAANVKEKFERLFQEEAPFLAYMEETNEVVVSVGDFELRITKGDKNGTFYIAFDYVKPPQMSLGAISRFSGGGLYVSQFVWGKDRDGVRIIEGYRVSDSNQQEIPQEIMEEADVFEALFELIQKMQAQPETAKKDFDTLTQQASLAFTTAARLIALAAFGKEYRSLSLGSSFKYLPLGIQGESKEKTPMPPSLRDLSAMVALLRLYMELGKWVKDLKKNPPSSTSQ